MLDPLLARIDEVLAERMAALGGAHDEEAGHLEGSLRDFVEAAWPTVDGSHYMDNWSITALSEHLQAVTENQISRLLINVPPRSGKTLVASVCFPAWTWARRERSFRSGPGVKFLCGSYGHTLSMMNSNLTRRLILSPFYQDLWRSRFALSSDQNSKTQFDTTEGGSRIATSVGGALLGVGYSICIVDDAHNTGEIESEAERQTALAWWSEISTTRMNDPKQSAQIVVMQRLHESDISGKILESESDEWVHLMIPMRHDPARHCVTVPLGASEIAWEDPRADDGELMWPERWGEAQVEALEAGLGPYLSSGRLQQSPAPKGGGIFKADWFQLWDPPNNKFPPLEFIIASVDGAFTSKTSNDPSALSVWGIFLKDGQRRIMLLNAWRKHLQFSADRNLIAERPNEPYAVWRQRTREHWGLLEHIRDSCLFLHGTRLGAGGPGISRLLIEAAGPGLPAAQELSNRYPEFRGVIQPIVPKGDKLSRALAVQPTLSQGLVYAPDRDWSELLIREAENFPYSKHDDLTDTMSMALKYLRDVGLAQTDHEERYEALQGVMHKPRLKALYPC